MKLRRSERDTFGVRRMVGRLKIGDRIKEGGKNGRKDPGKNVPIPAHPDKLPMPIEREFAR
jgi:hypothetical protein